MISGVVEDGLVFLMTAGNDSVNTRGTHKVASIKATLVTLVTWWLAANESEL